MKPKVEDLNGYRLFGFTLLQFMGMLAGIGIALFLVLTYLLS